jgi:hypothetical protein
MGAAYKNRQQETVEQFIEVASAYPELMQLGSDILLKNIDGIGFDQLAERSRELMLQQGIIPQDQMTQEEQQRAMEASQQPPQPDPNMVIAEAEMLKGQADLMAQQNKQIELELKATEIQSKAQGQTDKLNSETELNLAKIMQENERLRQSQEKIQGDFALKMTELEQKFSQDLNAQLAANTLTYDPETGTFSGNVSN